MWISVFDSVLLYVMFTITCHCHSTIIDVYSFLYNCFLHIFDDMPTLLRVKSRAVFQEAVRQSNNDIKAKAFGWVLRCLRDHPAECLLMWMVMILMMMMMMGSCLLGCCLGNTRLGFRQRFPLLQIGHQMLPVLLLFLFEVPKAVVERLDASNLQPFPDFFDSNFQLWKLQKRLPQQMQRCQCPLQILGLVLQRFQAEWSWHESEKGLRLRPRENECFLKIRNPLKLETCFQWKLRYILGCSMFRHTSKLLRWFTWDVV